MAVIKGIGRLFWSPITAEDEKTGEPTYGPMVYLEGLREVTIKPVVEDGEFYAEDRLWESERVFSKVDVSLDVSDLKPEHYIKITGARAAENGGIIDGGNDSAPYGALHYEKNLTGGIMEYATLFKGKLSKPEEKAKTAEGKAEFQSKSVEGTFMSLKNVNADWRHVVRSNDADFKETEFLATWGDSKVYKLPKAKTSI